VLTLEQWPVLTLEQWPVLKLEQWPVLALEREQSHPSNTKFACRCLNDGRQQNHMIENVASRTAYAGNTCLERKSTAVPHTASQAHDEAISTTNTGNQARRSHLPAAWAKDMPSEMQGSTRESGRGMRTCTRAGSMAPSRPRHSAHLHKWNGNAMIFWTNAQGMQ